MQYSLLDHSEMEDTKKENGDIEGNRFLLEEDRQVSCFSKLNNQTVLAITCSLFAIFVIAEIIGALVRNFCILQFL